jgi:hypothetical protein
LVKSAAIKAKTDKFSIQLAVSSDTITSLNFYKTLSILDSLKFDNFDVRLITEEEKVVLESKLLGSPYNFYTTKWKSRFSNNLFPPPKSIPQITSEESSD